MAFQLSFWDLSLLTAITSIILLITSEMLSPYYGKINLPINRKRLNRAALTFSTIFLATVAIRIVSIVLA